MSAAPEGRRVVQMRSVALRVSLSFHSDFLLSLSVSPNSSLIDTHFWRGFFFSQAMEAEPGPSVKSAQPIRSDEGQRDDAPRPIEAEESARPERGTVIRTGPKLVRLQNVASGK